MRILLVNPPGAIKVYDKSKIVSAVTEAPFITCAVLAAAARQTGATVHVLDLMLSHSPAEDLQAELASFNPDMVGATFTTPLYYEGQAIARIAKKHNPTVITICGGVHASCMPEETLADGDFDLVCIGEGDTTIAELAAGNCPETVAGLVIKKADGSVFYTPPRQPIANLDDLPMPAYDLYSIQRYKSSRVTSKRDPVGYIETNRGCPYVCTYCSQTVFGHKVRAKSAERVVEEYFYLRSLGFNDVHNKDNNFTSSLERAKTICELLIRKGWDRPWSLPTGIRTKDLDREFVALAKRSGCYAIAFGVESGDEAVLAGVRKKQDLEQMRKAIDLCTNMGIETAGFFMLGLPDDTIESMERTIDYACSLNLTYAKASMTLPFPSSAIYADYEKRGLITSRDWSKYNFHTAPEVYRHPTLDWSVIRRYYSKFYQRYYFRPSYVAKRLLRGVATGEIVHDMKYFGMTDWR